MSGDTTSKQPVETTESGGFFNRRDILKALATLPVVGFFFAKLGQKYNQVQAQTKATEEFMKDLGLDDMPSVLPSSSVRSSGQTLRLGIIGCGSRGEYVLRACGYAHPTWVESMKMAREENPNDTRLEDFFNQDTLDIVVNGVCDVFDVRAEYTMESISQGSNTGEYNNPEVKRFRTYERMLESPDIDAVIVATPEHWHAQMAIDAAKAGKHIYLEKPFSRTIPEAYRVYDEVKKSGIKLQLGHQSRQTDAYYMAREVVNKGVLGNISIVSLTTNRNDPNGAWIYNIHPEASPMNIDWRQFLGPAPRRPFNMNRFFRWRLWYDYGTGLSGDLFTHEYDAVNMILDLGIPKSAVATGGVYFYKDGREVPDVYQANYEYPDRDLTLLYSATLSNTAKRGKLFMGSDATMDLGQLHASALAVTPDMGSERYKERIENGFLDPENPMFTYSPGSKGFDAVATATEKYFAGRGLLYTYRDGKRVDTTHLHIAEWLNAIRNDGETSCNIERGFEEAVTAHMGTLAYKTGKRVEWDHENRRLVGDSAVDWENAY